MLAVCTVLDECSIRAVCTVRNECSILDASGFLLKIAKDFLQVRSDPN